MKKNLWEKLDELFAELSPKHSSKFGPLYIRERKEMPVDFKGHPPSRPAVVFKVVNKKPTRSSVASLHNVVIARYPVTGMFHIWCGDATVVKRDRETESRCEFWDVYGKRRKDMGYLCKHGAFVMQTMNADPAVKAAVETAIGRAPVSAAQEGRLAKAFALGKSVLLYGPTGSRKTRMVRDLLAAQPDCAVIPLHISDGLEDVDVLQKLLPDPDGKGWARTKGEILRAFESARERKTVVHLEELTRSSRSLRNLLIKTMDRQDGTYSLHDITSGEHITVPAENLIYIATANLGYSDTSRIDPALLRRFPVTLFQDYDELWERKHIGEKLGSGTAACLCAVARAIREQHRAGRLPCPLDTGSLIEWADLVGANMDLEEAAEMTWLYRVVETDAYGYPEEGQLSVIRDLLAAA